jgi:hypothetical protein
MKCSANLLLINVNHTAVYIVLWTDTKYRLNQLHQLNCNIPGD